jgi:DNA-binding MarR family transcriptional regulator
MAGDADPVTADDAATRIGWAWRELRRGASTTILAERLFGKPGEPDAVEPAQLDVLDLLTRRDRRRMSDLAAALRVDPSTVTRTLQRMEGVGLAQRAPAAGDGRVVMVQLTDEGRRVHAAVAARRATIMREVLATFSPAERDQLVHLVERFVTSLEDCAARVDRQRTDVSG